jgi:hypothetical protein
MPFRRGSDEQVRHGASRRIGAELLLQIRERARAVFPPRDHVSLKQRRRVIEVR